MYDGNHMPEQSKIDVQKEKSSLKTLSQRCREWCTGKDMAAKLPRDVAIIGILVLASLLSFWFGYLAGLDVGQGTESSPTVSPGVESGVSGQVIASKNGTRYYPQGCPGAERISEANKVWFSSAAAAEAAGYARAANCEGF